MLKNIPKICRECGEDCLVWYPAVKNMSSVVDGRLRSNDLKPIFFLGCECCSETMLVVDAQEIADLLNEKGDTWKSVTTE